MGVALAAGLFIAGAKWWVTFSSRNTLDEERRISSLFIKRLLLRSGPVPNSIYRIDDPDADPAFAVIVDETIGLEGYEEGLANAKADWSNGHHMPPEVVAQLSKWPQMNAIDRKLVAVAKRIGSADHKNLLHDIRVIVMREMYRRIDPNATDPFPMALNEIIAEVPRLSPIYRLLDATRKEYTGQDLRGIRSDRGRSQKAGLKSCRPPSLKISAAETVAPYRRRQRSSKTPQAQATRKDLLLLSVVTSVTVREISGFLNQN